MTRPAKPRRPTAKDLRRWVRKAGRELNARDNPYGPLTDHEAYDLARDVLRVIAPKRRGGGT